MNWLDIVILVLVVAGAVMGFRTGLLGAAVIAAGTLLGWLLAGALSDEVGRLFSGSLSNATLVTVISYALIIGVTLLITRLVWKVVRPLLTAATLGLAAIVDRLGGVVFGAIVGCAVAGALIIAMARFTYNFELPQEGVAGAITDRIPRVQDTKESVEGALTASAIVPVFIDVARALPGNALGFVPSDFMISLDILEQNIGG